MKKIIQSRWLEFILALLLVLATLAVFLQVRHFQFVDFDDYLYITQNSHIQDVSKENLIWAFTAQYAANWHPVTWLSHMADYHFFGISSGRHHLVSLFIHSLNTLTLGLLLLRLTGKLWQSFAISLLFAVHPLHVESVAWVSERKDLLCAFFGLTSVYSFSLYVERKKVFHYLLSLSLFALSLMSKPMLVTLPFLLLLLDYWPLERVVAIRGLLVEKLPFFALSLLSCVITFIVQKNGGAVSPLELVTPESRLINAVESYAVYVCKSVWPQNLTVFYPYENYEAGWSLSLAFALFFLCFITLFTIKYSKKRPYLPVGWFWFLGTLVPVIGIIQVGGQSMADRYMYLPLIGLLIIAVFGTGDALSGLTRRGESGLLVLLFVTVFFSLLSCRQAAYWKDSKSLFERATEVNPDNYMAHTRLGVALSLEGRIEEALEHYRKAVKIKPEYVTAHYDMAVDLSESGKTVEAAKEFETVVRLSPAHFSARTRLGDIYLAEGRIREAENQYLRAKRLKPKSPALYNTLGVMYAKNGEMVMAEEILSQGVLMFPDYSEIHNNLGLVYYYREKNVLAVRELKAAIKVKDNYPEAHNNLGLALVRSGSPEIAIKHFREALRLKPEYASALENLKNAEMAVAPLF